MNEIVLTREMLFSAAKIKPAAELRRSHRAIVAAHKATRTVSVENLGSEDGERVQITEPDHPTRLRAADLNLKLCDAYPKAASSLTGGGPMVVIWNTTATEVPPASARTALSSTSCAGSNGSTSSSVIAAGERPPSA